MTRTLMAAALLVLMGCATSDAPAARTANDTQPADAPRGADAPDDCAARGGLCSPEGCADSFGTEPIDAPCLLEGQPMVNHTCCRPPDGEGVVD